MAFTVSGITYGSLIKDHRHQGRVIELPEDSYGSFTIRTVRGNIYTIPAYNAEPCHWQGILMTGDIFLITDGSLRIAATFVKSLSENELVVKPAGMYNKLLRIQRSQIIGRMDTLRGSKFTVYQDK